MEHWLEHLEELARQSLPEDVYHFVSTGAGDGVSTSEAVRAWERFRFLPAVLRDVTEVDCSTELLGTPVSSPFAIAPTVMQRAAHPEGELAMARAATATETLMVVPGDAGTTFEEISATGVAWWLQIYIPSDRLACKPLLDRAVATGASAVVLTADTPALAATHDRAGQVWDIEESRWLRANLREASSDHPGHERAADLGPQDIDWLHKATGLPVVVKGVLRPGDARRCVDAGASAVWVSNHGGRQLDRVAATADCLAGVVGAVGADAEVYVDGGVRNAGHAVAALALGARGVFLGRPPFYALAVDGTDGVVRLLEELSTGLAETMRLLGCNRLGALTRDVLRAG